MSVIIYGPQGCGKTTHAKALAKHLGLSHIIDDGRDEEGNLWHSDYPIPEGTLVLTSAPQFKRDLDFYEVKVAYGFGFSYRAAGIIVISCGN